MMDAFAGGFFDLLSFLVGLLPSVDLPDVAGGLQSALGGLLGYLNWFFPVGSALSVTAAWASALLLYNAYLIVVGWVKTFKS